MEAFMSDENKEKGPGIAKSYLDFIDTNVLFKKPVSCLFAVLSLLIPVQFLFQIIQEEILFSKNVKLIIVSILVLAVLCFSGIFGSLIWLHRRIKKDEGPKIYPNFRRFVQTFGEWAGTMVALIVFGTVLITMLVLKDELDLIISMLPFPVSGFSFSAALFGPVAGFVIIIATMIFLFLLDPIIWLVKKIWALIVRIVLFFYRCVVKFSGTVEQNTPVWIGAVWLFSAAVVCTGISLCCRIRVYPNMVLFFAGVSAIALGLAMMAFLVIKRKNYDA